MNTPNSTPDVPRSAAANVNVDGELLLSPLASTPHRELLVWEDGKLRESLARGLAQSAAGDTVDLGSFATHADDALDE